MTETPNPRRDDDETEEIETQAGETDEAVAEADELTMDEVVETEPYPGDGGAQDDGEEARDDGRPNRE
jgi:hypothetical protein